MRDIALTLILIGLMPISFKKPLIGALVFAVIGLANPHRLTWGFAYALPWAMAYAGITIAGLVVTQERLLADSIKRYLPVLLYLAWMGITTALAFEPEAARSRLIQVTKIHLMCLVTLALLLEWKHVKWLVWVAVCSVAFFGMKGGVFTLITGGDFLVWGPPQSAIEDNNHLAVGLVMLMPMMYWVFTDARKRWLRWLILFATLMTAVAVFGSHSRSAFLAIVAMSAFLLMKSNHRLAVGLVGAIAAVVLVSFMPDKYWSRMESIRTYEQDASAMGRINVWRTAINIANDRVTGAGYEYYSLNSFRRYAPDPDDVHSSHSIYFQALGEHGWIGLGLFLSIWGYVWLRCRRVIKRAPDTDDGRSQALLAKMVQVSLVGFGVGGAFVNIGNWDLVYYLAIALLATDRIVAQAQRAPEAAAARPSFAVPRERTGEPAYYARRTGA